MNKPPPAPPRPFVALDAAWYLFMQTIPIIGAVGITDLLCPRCGLLSLGSRWKRGDEESLGVRRYHLRAYCQTKGCGWEWFHPTPWLREEKN